jgi:hypothetical protein
MPEIPVYTTEELQRIGEALAKSAAWRVWFRPLLLKDAEVTFRDSEFQPKTPDPIHNAIRKMR